MLINTNTILMMYFPITRHTNQILTF